MALPPVVTPLASSFTANLALRKPEIGGEESIWGVSLNGDFDLIDAVFAATGLGTSVGLNVGTGKTLNATGGTINATGDRLVLQDATTPTKKARFRLTTVPAGVTRDYFLPTASDTLVGLTQAQALSNKTVVDPAPTADTQALVSAAWVNDAIAAAVAGAVGGYSAFPTGDIVASAATTKAGWVKLEGGTIGKVSGTAASGTTARNLFDLFWAINGSAWPINGGRGASATADWDGGKTITLPDARGRALIGTGGDIGLTTLFAETGTETVALVEANLPAHTHTVPISSTSPNFGAGTPSAMMTSGGTTSTSSVGAGTAHSNVQPSMSVTYWIKL